MESEKLKILDSLLRFFSCIRHDQLWWYIPSIPSDDPNNLASLLGMSSANIEKIFLALGFGHQTKSKDAIHFYLRKKKIEARCLENGDRNIFYSVFCYNGKSKVVVIGIGKKMAFSQRILPSFHLSTNHSTGIAWSKLGKPLSLTQ